MNGDYAVTRSSVAAPTHGDLPRALTYTSSRTPGVSVNQAMGVGAVYRCIELLYTAGSSMDIQAVRRDGRALGTQPSVVRRPNQYESRRVTFGKTIASMAAYGECFYLLDRDDFGQIPAQIKVAPMSHITVKHDAWTDTTSYEIRTPDGRIRELRPFEIHHLKLMSMPGFPHGLGPIQVARSSVQGALDLEDYAGNWFGQTEVPEGILSSPDDMGADKAKRYSEMWTQARANGRTAVLGNGLKYQPIMIDPVDAQFIENRKMSVVEIARMFGVPATMLDAPSGDSATYSNQRDKNQVLLDFGLRRYLDEIEDALSEFLPLGTLARFQTDSLLRLNPAEQANVDQILINTKQRTVNELRERDGLMPLEIEQTQPAIEGEPNG